MDKKIEFSFPDKLITSSIRVKGLSPQLDGIIRYYNHLSAIFFNEAIECWNHEFYFACIALADESVARTISVELEGGKSREKREKVTPKNENFQGRVEALINEYPKLKPFRNKILKIHNHYRNTWFHVIDERVCYKEIVKGSSIKMGVIDSRQNKTKLGVFDTELLTGPDKEIHEKGLKEYHIISTSDKAAEDCLLLAADILKNAIPLLYQDNPFWDSNVHRAR